MSDILEIPATIIGHIATVAIDLGDLIDEVVFIGGAIAPLLQTHPPFGTARPTKDVDAVIATTSYERYTNVETRLRARGFRSDVTVLSHAHRWITPSGVLFDLVPAGDHIGATGALWDRITIETAQRGRLPSGHIIRYASAAGFLALKWKAFEDRGQDDPYGSHDLEDIIALVASRPRIVEEIANADARLKDAISQATANFLATEIADDCVSGALANVIDGKVVAEVRVRLREIASLFNPSTRERRRD